MGNMVYWCKNYGKIADSASLGSVHSNSIHSSSLGKALYDGVNHTAAPLPISREDFDDRLDDNVLFQIGLSNFQDSLHSQHDSAISNGSVVLRADTLSKKANDKRTSKTDATSQ